MRQVIRLQLPDVVPGQITTEPPDMKLVDPRDLFVDEKYQRGLSERSVKLIRKIVSEWDWRAFKPPVVVEHDGQMNVIDGQHTAIAAVTHGGIKLMPVLVIKAEEQAERANAFVRHNRDRIAVTPTQLYNAMVAAGDEDALTIEQVCKRAGVVILRNPPPMGHFRTGETLAIATIRALVNRRYALGARQVLEICAGMAPVSADAIKAVEYLLFAPEYKDEITAEQIKTLLSLETLPLDREVSVFAAERKVPKWRAMASVLYQNRRRARRA
jgi:hypothetical protein